MIGAIAHRGPNGIRVARVAGATLAHARLSIIDLEGGWQPLHAAGSTIVGNGEIYNYIELTEEFGLQDKLTTGSDFEPLLHLYALEGEKAFGRLRGMYAFCLIGGDGRTWLVRDPFGIKPLYVTGERFASEPRALGPVRLAEHAAQELLGLNYVLTDPLRAPPGSITPLSLEGRGVRGEGERGAASGVAVEAPPETTCLAWREHPHPRSLPHRGGGTIINQLDAILEDSVRVHQRSDVPYGLFLSGGIDSTAIATLMARLNERPVTAFTCGFDVPEARDERAAAEKVARALNLDWRESTFTEEDFWRIAPEVAWHLDDPTTDYACLPTYKLAEAAKGTLTVVLSGEGGDELFAGYGRYRRALAPRLDGRPPRRAADRRAVPEGQRQGRPRPLARRDQGR